MSSTTEFFITVLETDEKGGTNEVRMELGKFLAKINNASKVKVHKATQDFHAKTGTTVLCYAGDEGFTVFIPDPVQGEYRLAEIVKVEGTGTIYLKTESNKDIKEGGYSITEKSKGVRLVSNGGEYIEF